MIQHRPAFIFLFIALSTSLIFASCRRDEFDPLYSESGLVANGDYRATSVQYNKPFRLFTHTGELTDQSVVSNYVATHPNLLAIAFVPDSETSLQIISTRTHTVYHNGKSYHASVENGVYNMYQPDTSVYSSSNPGSNIDFLFAIEQSYDSLKHQLLEMHNSYTRLERTSFDSYKGYHSYHFTGGYTNGEVSLPYTFVATKWKAENVLFALKANVQPSVNPGDTVLVREGNVVFTRR